MSNFRHGTMIERVVIDIRWLGGSEQLIPLNIAVKRIGDDKAKGRADYSISLERVCKWQKRITHVPRAKRVCCSWIAIEAVPVNNALLSDAQKASARFVPKDVSWKIYFYTISEFSFGKFQDPAWLLWEPRCVGKIILSKSDIRKVCFTAQCKLYQSSRNVDI